MISDLISINDINSDKLTKCDNFIVEALYLIYRSTTTISTLMLLSLKRTLTLTDSPLRCVT